MASPSLKKMGTAGRMREGNYASSDSTSTDEINREPGLTLLPGSQIQTNFLEHGAQATFRYHHAKGGSAKALDLWKLIGLDNWPGPSPTSPPSSEAGQLGSHVPISSQCHHQDVPTESSSCTPLSTVDCFESDSSDTSIREESDVGEDGQDFPSINHRSKKRKIEPQNPPNPDSAEFVRNPSEIRVDVNGSVVSQSFHRRDTCIDPTPHDLDMSSLYFPPMETTRFGRPGLAGTDSVEGSNVERFDVRDSSDSSSSRTLETGTNETTSGSSSPPSDVSQDGKDHSSGTNPPDNSSIREFLARQHLTETKILEARLHQLEKETSDLNQSLQAKTKQLEDERAEKEMWKSKVENLASFLRQHAPGRASAATLFRTVGMSHPKGDFSTTIARTPLLAIQIPTAPIQAQRKADAAPSTPRVCIDLTEDASSEVAAILPASSNSLSDQQSSQNQDPSPLATLHNRLEKRPLEWLEGCHPLTGKKNQKAYEPTIDWTTRTIVRGNTAKRNRGAGQSELRTVKRAEAIEAKKARNKEKRIRKKDAEKAAQAQPRKDDIEGGSNGVTPARDWSKAEQTKHSKRKEPGQPQNKAFEELPPADEATLANLIGTSEDFADDIHSTTYPGGEWDDDVDGLAAELEAALEAEDNGDDENDALAAELEAALEAKDY